MFIVRTVQSFAEFSARTGIKYSNNTQQQHLGISHINKDILTYCESHVDHDSLI